MQISLQLKDCSLTQAVGYNRLKRNKASTKELPIEIMERIVKLSRGKNHTVMWQKTLVVTNQLCLKGF